MLQLKYDAKTSEIPRDHMGELRCSIIPFENYFTPRLDVSSRNLSAYATANHFFCVEIEICGALLLRSLGRRFGYKELPKSDFQFDLKQCITQCDFLDDEHGDE